MAHGAYGKRRVSGRTPNGLGVRSKEADKKEKKAKAASLRNQIRSIQRLLRKNLPQEVKEAQEKKLDELRKLVELQAQSELERKMALRYRKVKFFERRKIERRIRRLEKQQRVALEHSAEEVVANAGQISQQLSRLKEDLEYVRFFPKTEKYISIFMGVNDPELVGKRNKLREQIKANLAAAAASGVDLEETGSDDDGAMDISEDEFFMAGSSSDEVDADDEWTDKSTREPASSASGKATSGMSSDEKNKKSARDLMPPPRPWTNPSTSTSSGVPSRSGRPSSSHTTAGKARSHVSSRRLGGPSSNSQKCLKNTSSQGGSLSSNSDAQKKPRRKRRPKKKK
ncbi:rRNA-processing protein EFG1 isoform X2 [Cryptomeria japonica]|uniref:rRNA-processing protein EFG1 isoform X2 n=1 Tax=Cryptomeria japonica TaxID=3369 RepID=UPI0027DA9059|nr:rRNA-processing protein EFG1 isoform X2 [Cryptomeria japonica]